MSEELIKRLREAADYEARNWGETDGMADLLREAAEALSRAAPATTAVTCTYPNCNCPFDAPADPSWCARGLPRRATKPDCNTCANRGRVDGLSQETHCEHCIWQESWRTDHYAPKQENGNGL